MGVGPRLAGANPDRVSVWVGSDPRTRPAAPAEGPACVLLSGRVVPLREMFVPPLRSAGLALCLAAVPVLCPAQLPALKLPSFMQMRREAVESVSITVGPIALWFAGRVIGAHDPDSAVIKKLLRGLHKVQVRSFRFKADHVYAPAELQALRLQLSGPAWHQMVQVRDPAAGGDVDIYYALDERTVTGLAILAAAPREFTVVNISGNIDLEQVAYLRRTFTHGAGGGAQSPLTAP